MQVSMKSLVVLGVVTSLWSVGCSSRPSGSQPSAGTPSPAETVYEVATSTDSPGDRSVASEVGTSKKPSDGVASEVGTSKKPSDGVDSKITPPIIGQLKSRHHTILIHTDSDGPRFTVSTLDGKVIAEALSVDEMQAQHPEIYKTYKESFANYEGYLDASLHLEAPAGR